MEDKCILIYNEIIKLQQQLRDYHDDVTNLSTRVTALEYFKNTAMGVCITVGVLCKYAWDYVVERFT